MSFVVYRVGKEVLMLEQHFHIQLAILIASPMATGEETFRVPTTFSGSSKT